MYIPSPWVKLRTPKQLLQLRGWRLVDRFRVLKLKEDSMHKASEDPTPKPETECAKRGCHAPKASGSVFCPEHAEDPCNTALTCDNLPAVRDPS